MSTVYRFQMEVVPIATVDEFLALTESYRLADPLRTNVVSSVASAVAHGDRTYDAHFWWAALGEAGECVGAAFRTAPFALHIGPMPPGAWPLLARAVADRDDAFTRIVGSEDAVTVFLEAYAACGIVRSRRHFTRGVKSLLYELGELAAPGVEGSYRVATVDDIGLVAQWTRDFQEFTGIAAVSDERERDFLITRLNEQSLRLWSVNDTPVAMAGHAATFDAPTGSVTRVGPVFTPERLRGRGYGSAVTAALCQELLSRGSRVILYADADYPTSNRVYQRLGFRLIDDLIEFDEDAGT
jgi:GNAT superfamily N-acetyltransferase